MPEFFLEVDYYQICKHRQIACGDSFFSRKFDDRIVTVLADGLGSGIKASVLATLTTTMATSFISSHMDIKRAAEVILETLPVCSYRKIGYSTFTIVDACFDGKVSIIEHDNPSFVLIRNGQIQEVPKQEITLKTERRSQLFYTQFTLEPEDRIVFYSDGVSQAGMGMPHFPLGWLETGADEYIQKLVKENSSISAGEISKMLTLKAQEHDGSRAADDITSAAIYMRNPRRTLLMTGPPYIPAHDKELAEIAISFEGKKVICGGTTAAIVSRETGIPLFVNLKEVNYDSEIPPTAAMQGYELVTEGTITLSKALKILEKDPPLETLRDDAVKKLITVLLNSDIIRFVVGTKINDAHQDPALPKDLEIRRNLVKQMAQCLESKYMKQTSVEFI
jgi:hypothetical protein